MQILLRTIIIVLLGTIVPNSTVHVYGQNFEGEILYVKQSTIDTSYISFKIKGGKVRYEELNSDLQIANYMIADLLEKNIYAINPKRKLFVDLPVYQWNEKPDSINFNISKTGNYKVIKGFKCFQWRVLNRKDDTEVQIWAPDDKFDFYSKFLILLNQSEKTSQYYLNSPEIYGKLPLELNERSLLREMRMRLEVVRIEKKTMQASLFEIPVGYKLFEKN